MDPRRLTTTQQRDLPPPQPAIEDRVESKSSEAAPKLTPRRGHPPTTSRTRAPPNRMPARNGIRLAIRPILLFLLLLLGTAILPLPRRRCRLPLPIARLLFLSLLPGILPSILRDMTLVIQREEEPSPTILHLLLLHGLFLDTTTLLSKQRIPRRPILLPTEAATSPAPHRLLRDTHPPAPIRRRRTLPNATHPTAPLRSRPRPLRLLRIHTILLLLLPMEIRIMPTLLPTPPRRQSTAARPIDHPLPTSPPRTNRTTEPATSTNRTTSRGSIPSSKITIPTSTGSPSVLNFESSVATRGRRVRIPSRREEETRRRNPRRTTTRGTERPRRGNDDVDANPPKRPRPQRPWRPLPPPPPRRPRNGKNVWRVSAPPKNPPTSSTRIDPPIRIPTRTTANPLAPNEIEPNDPNETTTKTNPKRTTTTTEKKKKKKKNSKTSTREATKTSPPPNEPPWPAPRPCAPPRADRPSDPLRRPPRSSSTLPIRPWNRFIPLPRRRCSSRRWR
mmetsp:Transcript_30245/g.62843  ORF Transcript_30245/g.62843 Transcript_30245/m.62843 type:complete len:504 (-) Transcript_30245:1259-2770(-)